MAAHVTVHGLHMAPPHMPGASSQDTFGNLPDSAGFPMGRSSDGFADVDKSTDVTRARWLQVALRLLQLGLSTAAFSLMAKMQTDTNNVALTLKPFAFLLVVGILSAVYASGTIVFLILMPSWPQESYHGVAKTQKIFLHIDFVMALLLFAASCSTASIFPLYCSAGMTTPTNICMQMFGSSVVGLMSCFAYVTLFWFLVTPYLWRR